jgi:hypothetical protein
VDGVALVFLDVDGTLLPFGAAGGPLSEGIDRRLGPALAALPADLVWATTWMDEANDSVAPLLGLPRLPVLDPAEPTAEDTYFGLHWKTRAIAERAAERPFAWLDDEITAADQEWVAERHDAEALLLRIDPRTGLTVDDVDAVGRWLAEVGAAADRLA